MNHTSIQHTKNEPNAQKKKYKTYTVPSESRRA